MGEFAGIEKKRRGDLGGEREEGLERLSGEASTKGKKKVHLQV